MDGVVLKLHTADGREVVRDRRPAGRFGRLAPPLDDSTPDTHVRCSCDDCGAHLLGSRTNGRGANGVCLVCGSMSIRPL